MIDRCFADRRNLWSLAPTGTPPPTRFDRLARDPDRTVRLAVAQRNDVGPEVLALLQRTRTRRFAPTAAVRPLFQARPHSSRVAAPRPGRPRTHALVPGLRHLTPPAGPSGPCRLAIAPAGADPAAGRRPRPVGPPPARGVPGERTAETVLEAFVARPDLRETLT
ncbi:hypothetical protein GCM10020229_60320 [Kitasatospora albolonga]